MINPTNPSIGTVQFPQTGSQPINKTAQASQTIPEIQQKAVLPARFAALESENKAQTLQTSTFNPLGFDMAETLSEMGEKVKSTLENLTPDIKLKQVNLLLKAGKTESAQKVLDKILADDPQNVDALFTQGRVYHVAGETDKAEAVYKQILEIEPNHTKALGNIGVLAANAGDFETAIEYFGKTVAAMEASGDKELPQAYLFWAQAHRDQGNPEAALEVLDQAIAVLPADQTQKLLTTKDEIAGKAEQWDKVVEARESLLASAPDDIELQYKLGQAYQFAGDSDKAKEIYAHILETNPNHAKTLGNLGVLAANADDFGVAIEYFDQTVELMKASGDKELPKAYEYLASAHQDQGDLPGALAVLNQAIAYLPADQSKDLVSKKNQIQEAILNQTQTVLEASPDDAKANQAVGQALLAIGRVEDAKPYLEKSQTLDPHQRAEFDKQADADTLMETLKTVDAPVAVNNGKTLYMDSWDDKDLKQALGEIEGLDFEVKLAEDYTLDVVINNGSELNEQQLAQLQAVLENQVLEPEPVQVQPEPVIHFDNQSDSGEIVDTLKTSASPVVVNNGKVLHMESMDDTYLKRALGAIDGLDFEVKVGEGYTLDVVINNGSVLTASQLAQLENVLKAQVLKA